MKTNVCIYRWKVYMKQIFIKGVILSAAGVIDYTRDAEAGQLLIGGVSDYEYFEQVPYAE